VIDDDCRVVFTFDPSVQYSLNTYFPLVTDEYVMNNFIVHVVQEETFCQSVKRARPETSLVVYEGNHRPVL